MISLKARKTIKKKMLAHIENGEYDKAKELAEILGESDRTFAEYVKAIGIPVAQLGCGVISTAVHSNLVKTGYQLEESGVAFTSATLRGVGPAKKP